MNNFVKWNGKKYVKQIESKVLPLYLNVWNANSFMIIRCGYRVVRNVTNLWPYVRFLYWSTVSTSIVYDMKCQIFSVQSLHHKKKKTVKFIYVSACEWMSLYSICGFLYERIRNLLKKYSITLHYKICT